MKFALLGYSQEQYWDAMSKSEQDTMLEDCFAYDSKLLKNGHMLDGGVALQPSRTAKTLRWQKGRLLISDGPYAETKELLGGVGILEARDMEQAVELLSRHPGLRHGATFEVRPIDEEALKRQTATVAALGGSAPAPDARAIKFATFGYTPDNDCGSMTSDQRDAKQEHCQAFLEDQVRRGQWLSGVGLQSVRTAKTLRAKAGRLLVTDGPYAETKECLGGVIVLAVTSMSAVVEAFSEHPPLQPAAAIEIRPIAEEISRRWQVIKG
jgi:hypothetical protein